jgi:glycosyltransferase involved in cell wall biosynthesis
MTLHMLVAPKGGREIPSSRYRIHDLVPLLDGRGWTVSSLTPSTRRDRRAWNAARDTLRAARGHDALVIQRPGRRREELPLLRLAHRRSTVAAVDVDDPIDETGAAGWALDHADVILAGSRALVERYAGRGAEVVYAPTPLDVARYDLQRPPSSSTVVGWIGDGPAYADPLVRMVAAAARAPGRRLLRVIGTKGDAELERRLREAAAGASLELHSDIEWEDEDAVAREVAAFDVGLAPLRSAEGASFKTVQYLAAGVVPLVEAGGEAEHHARAALGDDAAVVAPDAPDAVAAQLARLDHDDLRAALGRRCRATARELFSREAAAERLDRVLRDARERRR